jgi:glutamate dehydrogenase
MSVPLGGAARTAHNLPRGALPPTDVMRAILKADVDLLFFGGIGTYIRASSETDAQAGDKANDAVRITGAEVRAKAIGEGANLGMTQRGRVEYALRGGKLNTDAIDNSAGVNSSDLEVNIKIALGSLTRAGTLDEKARVSFLSSMTREVAALCLRNNYLQSLAISLSLRDGLAALPSHISLMHSLEHRGLLSRDVEFLPGDGALMARAETGQGLQRPELAVLLAYAKNTLETDLLDSPVLDDLYLGKELYRYFPEILANTYPDSITNHRLRREVIATVLANAMLNRGGPSFVDDMVRTTSADAGQVASAYAAARDVYGLIELNAQVDALDGKVPGEMQLALYAEVRNLVVKETLWFLRNTTATEGLGAIIERYHDGVAAVRQLMTALVPKSASAAIAAQAKDYADAGVSRELAQTIAELPMMSFATDVVLVVQRTKATVAEASEAFFGVMQLFGLGGIVEAGERLVLGDRFDRMALDRALANLTRAQRDLTADVLAVKRHTVAERLIAWREGQAAAVDRAIAAVTALTEGELTVSRLTVAAGLLSDLALSA